jgi:hypothetical protein
MSASLCAQTPYNPDVDNDSLITFNDMLSFLPLYGQPFMPDLDEAEVQYCVFDTISECYVNDGTDIVIVQDPNVVNNPKVYLPEGQGWKSVLVMHDGSHPSGNVEVRGALNYQSDDAVMYEYLTIRYLGFFMRTPSGYWRTNEP